MKTMRSGGFFPALALAAGLAACATPAVVFLSPDYDARRVQRVAVADFDDYPGAPGSGEIAAGAFEKYLLWAGYGLIERRQARQLLQEQSISLPGDVDPSVIKQAGQILGVDALAFGGLTDFSSAQEQTTMVDMPQEQVDPVYGQVETVQRSGGAVVKTVQSVVTGYSTTETDQMVPETETVPAHAGLSVRLVDAQSGEVLWSGSAASDGVDPTAATEQASALLMQALVKQLKKAAPRPH
jgi:hypothetical protein